MWVFGGIVWQVLSVTSWLTHSYMYTVYMYESSFAYGNISMTKQSFEKIFGWYKTNIIMKLGKFHELCNTIQVAILTEIGK